MPVSFKRQDELDKMLAEFASFDHLDQVEFPDNKEEENHEETDKGWATSPKS